MESNIKDKVIFSTPKDEQERALIAGACVRKLGIKFPAVLDEFGNSTEKVYTGWPDRIYLIDQNGRGPTRASRAHSDSKPPNWVQLLPNYPDRAQPKLHRSLFPSDQRRHGLNEAGNDRFAVSPLVSSAYIKHCNASKAVENLTSCSDDSSHAQRIFRPKLSAPLRCFLS